uniref:Protein kinase domain-containing protein n=1 Tax=Macrostomum lignano TaxID=282301 RepID=A0A1I8F766_9PLAT
ASGLRCEPPCRLFLLFISRISEQRAAQQDAEAGGTEAQLSCQYPIRTKNIGFRELPEHQKVRENSRDCAVQARFKDRAKLLLPASADADAGEAAESRNSALRRRSGRKEIEATAGRPGLKCIRTSSHGAQKVSKPKTRARMGGGKQLGICRANKSVRPTKACWFMRPLVAAAGRAGLAQPQQSGRRRRNSMRSSAAGHDTNSNPLLRMFQTRRQTGSAGQELVWKVFEAVRADDGKGEILCPASPLVSVLLVCSLWSCVPLVLRPSGPALPLVLRPSGPLRPLWSCVPLVLLCLWSSGPASSGPASLWSCVPLVLRPSGPASCLRVPLVLRPLVCVPLVLRPWSCVPSGPASLLSCVSGPAPSGPAPWSGPSSSACVPLVLRPSGPASLWSCVPLVLRPSGPVVPLVLSLVASLWSCVLWSCVPLSCVPLVARPSGLRPSGPAKQHVLQLNTESQFIIDDSKKLGGRGTVRCELLIKELNLIGGGLAAAVRQEDRRQAAQAQAKGNCVGDSASRGSLTWSGSSTRNCCRSGIQPRTAATVWASPPSQSGAAWPIFLESATEFRRLCRPEIKESLTDLEIKHGIFQINEALKYLHCTQKVIHGNVSPCSILITKRGCWKLSGLGFVEKSSTLHMAQPDLDYLAPDLQIYGKALRPATFSRWASSFKAIFNGGVSLLDAGAVASSTTARSRSESAEGADATALCELAELVEKMLDREPRHRPSAQLLSMNKYFQDPLLLALEGLVHPARPRRLSRRRSSSVLLMQTMMREQFP